MKRTGVYCWVRSRRNSIVFDFTVGKVRNTSKGAKWKFKCLVGVTYLPLPVFLKEIATVPVDKKLNQYEMEHYGVKKIVKFCSQKLFISSLLYLYTPREWLGTAKLFMGVARNDVTVNNKGESTCNNTKQLLEASSLVTMLIQNLP